MMNVETINKAELNTDKLKSFLIDEIKRTLKAAFDEKSNSDKIKDDFSLKIGKAIADGIDEWIKGAVKPTEIDASGIEETVKEIQKEIVEYVERRWNDVTQTMQMLQNSMLGFSEGINPITIQTMQIAVGDESLQFRFVDSKVNPKTVDHIVTYNGQDKTLTAAQGIIQHMTMGITEIKAVHTDDEYMFWDVRGFTSHVLESTKPYYLYIRADKTSSDADFVLSEIAIPLEWSVGYYHFLTGILNSEYENTRAFVTLYGFTEILPGRITTNKIVSQDGKTYFDLLNSVIGGKIKFLSGTEEKDLDLWATEIEDTTGAMLLDIEELNNLIGDFESYIDDAFRDGIIEEAEAKAIEKYINSIINEKSSLEATYNKMYVNPLLTGTSKTNLLNAKITYFGRVTDLIDLINLVITDGKVTATEKQQVDTAFGLYSTDRATFATRIEEANQSIQNAIKDVADGAATASAELQAQMNTVKAITDKFGTTINGGLVQTVMMLLREAGSVEDTAGISGMQKSFFSQYVEYQFGISSDSITNPPIISIWEEYPTKPSFGNCLWMRYRTVTISESTGQPSYSSWSYQVVINSSSIPVLDIKLSSDNLTWHDLPFDDDIYMILLSDGVDISSPLKIFNEEVSEIFPALWAGGSYADAIAGNAEAILYHDGKLKLGGSGVHTIFDGNGMKVFNPFGTMNIRFGLKNGYAVMEYYDNDGNFLYDLGPNGISQLEIREEKWSEIKLIFLDDDISFVLTDSTTKAKYKSSWLQTETTYYIYTSEIVAGMNQDPTNDGKIFTAASTQSSIMTDGYYIQKVTVNAQYKNFGSGNRIYPVGIHPSNEAVYDIDDVLMIPIFHYESGKHTTGWYAYWND